MQTGHTTEFGQLVERCGLSKNEIAAHLGCSVRTIYRWQHGVSQPRKAAVDRLSRLVRETSGQPAVEKFQFIDLFAGIGGLRTAFDSIGGRCVFTSEWDQACRRTYLENYDCDHPIEGDITGFPASKIPRHDVLLAGFPCQPFSIAGVSKKNALGHAHGFLCETQGTLFFDVARIIDHHQPIAFLLENVKNLLRHDKGNTFKIIIKTLKDIGYYVDHRVINAKAYVPQNRERVFIAGFKKDTGFDFKSIDLPSVEDGPTLSSILHTQDGSEKEEPPYTEGNMAKISPRYTLTRHLWNYLKDYAAKHRAKGNGFGYGLVGPEDVARTMSARYYKDGAEILIRQRGKRPRRLTPRECARLMGFDVPGKPRFKIPVSDTQAYKQFGNSVVVPVVRDVAEFMLPHITNTIRGADSRMNLEHPVKQHSAIRRVAHG